MASTRTCGQKVNKTDLRWRGTDLDGVLVGEEVDDLKCVCDDANCHELLAVVAALHHQANVIPMLRYFLRNQDYNAHLSTNRSTMGI
jgi:hypothetical protein